MDHRLLSRRSALLGGAVLALSATQVRAQATPTSSPTAAFPATIDHLYGTTTIDVKPVRVVTLGWSSADAAIALGVIPVGIPADNWAGDSDGFLPWTRAAIGDAPLPTSLQTDSEIPFEDIIGLNPDLILAPYSGITEDDYATLSKIAPTIPPIEALWSSSWQEVTRVAGIALGLTAEAEQLIADTNAHIATEAANYPKLSGKSFIYGDVDPDANEFDILIAGDPRPQFLEQMGLVPAELVLKLSEQPSDVYYSPVSFELANTLVADIIVFWFTDQSEYDAASQLSAYQAIPAYADNRIAAIIGREYVMATSAFSTLSINFALDEFLPTLAGAAANVS
jgi:iron complex transport system substrate-binding protein